MNVMWIRRIGALLGLLLVLAACGSALETDAAASSITPTSDSAVATTAPTVPTSVATDPTRISPNDYNSPSRVAGFEGLAVEIASQQASEAGWEFIEVHDMDFEPGEQPADYLESAIGLYVESGIVLEAWSGDFRIP